MYIYRLVSALIIGIYLMSPLLIDNWGSTDEAWYSPFLPWLALILMAAVLESKRGGDEL
ncbi:hypothetical protein [Motiliproteus sediminis]|uniref:hypothetical protein n=1 Tax=Motiliproteus sediminis TaxID=1468178 RepID=UPI001AEFF2BA|nr:hypothetical protein [Motiliproteus sediminis]